MHDIHKPTPFVILMLGRSGSSHLVELLGSHPRILAKGECLVGFKDKGSERQIAWVKDYLAPHAPSPHAAIGFKTKLRDVCDKEQFAHVLQQLQARIIHMRRRNLVKITISSLNCLRIFEHTGDWNLSGEAKPLPPQIIDIDAFAAKLAQFEQAIQLLEQYVSALGLPTLSFHYEDLLTNERAAIERVFEFLGVESAPIKSAYRKNTSDDLRRAVVNFDELRIRYAGSKYEDMFDEVLVTPDGGVGTTKQ